MLSNSIKEASCLAYTKYCTELWPEIDEDDSHIMINNTKHKNDDSE